MATADKQFAFTSSTGYMKDLTSGYVNTERDACEEVPKEQTIKGDMEELFDIICIQRNLVMNIAEHIGVSLKPTNTDAQPAQSLSEAIRGLVIMAQINNEYLMCIRERLG